MIESPRFWEERSTTAGKTVTRSVQGQWSAKSTSSYKQNPGGSAAGEQQKIAAISSANKFDKKRQGKVVKQRIHSAAPSKRPMSALTKNF
jgi:hypothetical protein